MPKQVRTEISDLITEYQLHKDRRHLFVEGEEDRSVLRWYLKRLPNRDVGVYCVETIEINQDLLEQYGLSSGNKSRLLVLAKELDRLLPNESKQVLCVVDADFDHLLGKIETNRYLIYTDETSMDMYAFTESNLERVLRLGFRDEVSEASSLLDILYPALQELFIIRAANEAMGLNLTWISFDKCCRIYDDGRLTFDQEKYLRHYLENNDALDQHTEFVRVRDNLRERAIKLPVRAIRGRDFSKLLSLYLRKAGRTTLARAAAKEELIARMFFVCLNREDMKGAPLFRRVSRFLI